MAATARLTWAALALLPVFVAFAAPRAGVAQPRAAGRASSLLAALGATDTALVGRVTGVQPESGGERADIEVLETLRGAQLPSRIAVRAGAGALLEGAGAFAPGETALLLVTRAGDAFELPSGLRLAKVTLEGDTQRREAGELVRAWLDASPPTGDARALDALLRRSIALENARLRAGVLEDLSHRLVPADTALLVRLAQDRAATPDVRRFAILGLAGLAAPLPSSLADLLRPDEPLEIRRAALNAYAARKDAGVLERALADPDEEIRKSAVENLASPDAVAPLEGHFAREPSARVRIAVVKQLGLIGTDASRSALRRILDGTSDAEIHRAGERWLSVGE